MYTYLIQLGQMPIEKGTVCVCIAETKIFI